LAAIERPTVSDELRVSDILEQEMTFFINHKQQIDTFIGFFKLVTRLNHLLTRENPFRGCWVTVRIRPNVTTENINNRLTASEANDQYVKKLLYYGELTLSDEAAIYSTMVILYSYEEFFTFDVTKRPVTKES
jgi:hypothetical protein